MDEELETALVNLLNEYWLRGWNYSFNIEESNFNKEQAAEKLREVFDKCS